LILNNSTVSGSNVTEALDNLATNSGFTLINAEYKFSTSTSNNPPTGVVRLNNATYSSVTNIYLSETTNNGVDGTLYLQKLKIGDTINFQQQDDSSKICKYTITALPTDNGSWWDIQVAFNSSTGALWSNNKVLLLAFKFFGSGNPIGSDTTKEDVANKQNSLAVDGTGKLYPTVDAVNVGITPTTATFNGTNISLQKTAGTIYAAYSQTAIINFAIDGTSVKGGFSSLKLTANGNAINMDASWKNVGSDVVTATNGLIHRFFFYREDSEVWYSVKVS
jgi:hypothetical protein